MIHQYKTVVHEIDLAQAAAMQDEAAPDQAGTGRHPTITRRATRAGMQDHSRADFSRPMQR